MAKTIGVIGYGSIGKRHAKNLEQLGCKVLVYDPMQTVGPHAPLPEVMATSDAIVVASPTETHYHYALDAIDSGKPVFVEKPIADKLDDVLKAITMVGCNLRFHAGVIQTKKLLDAKMIGDIVWASVTVSQLNTKYKEHVITNWGAHEIDLIRYLLGDAQVVTADASTQNIADVVLQHDSGPRSVVHLDYLTNPEIRATTIVGTQGQIVLDVAKRWGCIAWADGRPPETATFTDSFDQNYLDEMKAFLDRIDGKIVPGATGEDGLEVLKLCLAARDFGKKNKVKK